MATQSAADQGDPVAGGEQPAQQRPAPARALRPGQAEAVGDRGVALGGSWPGQRLLRHWPAASWSSGALGFSSRALSRSASAAAVSPACGLDPRAQVVELPVAVLALDRVGEVGDRGRVVPLKLGEQPQLDVGGGGPGLDRAGALGVVDRAADVAARRPRPGSPRPRARPAAARSAPRRRSRRWPGRRSPGRSGGCPPARPPLRCSACELARTSRLRGRRRRGRRPPRGRPSPRTSRMPRPRRRRASRRPAPRSALAAAPRAARQAAKPHHSRPPTRPSTSSPPTTPSSANASR